jgi:hypothetical protein
MGTHTDEQENRETARACALGRVSRLEWAVAAVAAVVLAGLVVAEPDVLDAPLENTRTVVFTFGGTAVAAFVLVVMLSLRVHPIVRVLVLGIPFVAVSWWLLSPFFVDDVVDDDFATSIADARPAPDAADDPDSESTESTLSTADAVPVGPTLRGAGEFVGLAGHEGSGDAGFFALEDGSHVLRLENFDIDNGPDLRLYVVPGVDQTDPIEDSLYLGELRGNVGDQSYDLPAEFVLTPGNWTVLVWCEAFSVEFVAASVAVT